MNLADIELQTTAKTAKTAVVVAADSRIDG
jgi:hypothetical protein